MKKWMPNAPPYPIAPPSPPPRNLKLTLTSFRMAPGTIQGPSYNRFHPVLQNIIQDVQNGDQGFSFGGIHPTTVKETMEVNVPWTAPPFLTFFKHLLLYLKSSNPERQNLKNRYTSFPTMLFKLKSASRPSETGAADRALRDEIVDLWIRAWEEQPEADRGRAKVKKEDLESYY